MVGAKIVDTWLFSPPMGIFSPLFVALECITNCYKKPYDRNLSQILRQ